MKRICIAVAALLLSPVVDVSAALIAEVRTSVGNFSIDLNYTGARRTVSHFMQLAAGNQPWLDEKTGQVRTGVPFYTGLKFHKKVYQLAPVKKYIQTGARYPDDPSVFIPNDNQGAGYVLRDEIRRYVHNGSLVVPHGLYTVSMANTGPNSGSSQFLINLANDTSWNGRNSAFGTVLQQFKYYNNEGVVIGVSNGWQVLNTIFTSGSSVSISSITFRATDPVAAGFDPSLATTELAVVGKRQIESVSVDATDVTLGYAALLNPCEIRVQSSVDLWSWLPAPSMTTFVPAGVAATTSVGHGNFPNIFFRSTGAVYPISAVPQNLLGKGIRIALGIPYSSPVPNVIQLNIDEFGIENTYYLYSNGSTGTFSYTFTPRGPYYGDLVVTPDGLTSQTYRLYFGGMNLDVTENEQMHAQIINGGGSPPTEARWYYTP